MGAYVLGIHVGGGRHPQSLRMGDFHTLTVL